MPIFTRPAKTVTPFAQSAQTGERTLFNSAGTSDNITSYLSAAFDRGFGTVPIGDEGRRRFELEDANAVLYALSYMISYLYQRGVAEWSQSQEYVAGSIVTYQGKLYITDRAITGGAVPVSTAVWTAIENYTETQALAANRLMGSTATANSGNYGIGALMVAYVANGTTADQTAAITPATTRPGSQLLQCNLNAIVTPSTFAQAGTWRALSIRFAGSSTNTQPTLWVRIA